MKQNLSELIDYRENSNVIKYLRCFVDLHTGHSGDQADEWLVDFRRKRFSKAFSEDVILSFNSF